MDRAEMQELVAKKMQLLRDKRGDPYYFFSLRNSSGDGTLMLFVQASRDDLLKAVRVVDDWYYRHDLCYQTYLKLRAEIYRSITEIL